MASMVKTQEEGAEAACRSKRPRAGAALLQRPWRWERAAPPEASPDGGEAQAAPDEISSSGHGANCFLKKNKKISVLLFCPGHLQRVGGAALQVQRSEELSGGRLRHRKKSQRSRRWLHTQICNLKAQPAHAAHQPQAASSQPNARGAVSQLGGAVRKGVPEARVGRQLGFQHPIAAARLPYRGQQPLAHSLGRELCVEDALGLRSSRWGAAPRRRPWASMGFPAKLLPKQRFQAQEFATLRIGAHLVQLLLAWLVILFCLR